MFATLLRKIWFLLGLIPLTNAAFAQCTNMSMNMFDSFGDGWNGASYTITNTENGLIAASGDLNFADSGDGASIGTDFLCLPDGCYSIYVGGGSWDSEISWNLTNTSTGTISGFAPGTITFDVGAGCGGGGGGVCGGLSTDPGGAGNYPNNSFVTETICADNAGDCVTLSFNTFSLEQGFDDLTIYDGPNVGSPLIGTYTGSNSPGVVTASSGCLTLVFSSDGSVTFPGWSAGISCSPCGDPGGGGLDEVGCPDIDAGEDIAIPTCTTPCTPVDLTADFFETGEPTSYEVTSIPYNPPYPFNTGTPFSINIDDVWTGVIDLPFDFCFYGTTYNQAIIGSNGVISFNIADAGGYCPWPFTQACPNPALPLNSIYGVYHDIDPSVCGDARYAILGDSPCRVFVVNFDDVCHFSCTNIRSTTQVVMYETTNAIEVYVQDKPTCFGWNSGNALIGLQNAAGTQGVVAPGRQTGPWSANNEAWRFNPSGPSIVDINWFSQTNGYVGNGATISVCPEQDTESFVAQATYTLCDGSTIEVSDDVVVTCAQILLPVEWLDFQADLISKDQEVLCTWQTATELNNDYFTIERSPDGVNWAGIGTVAAAGTTTEPQTYQWVDRNPLDGVSYYRIRQTDTNGAFDFSDRRAVARDANSSSLTVFPNPGQGQFVLSRWHDGAALRIVDMRGREVHYTLLGGGKVDLNGAATGQYIFEVWLGESLQPLRQIVQVQ